MANFDLILTTLEKFLFNFPNNKCYTFCWRCQIFRNYQVNVLFLEFCFGNLNFSFLRQIVHSYLQISLLNLKDLNVIGSFRLLLHQFVIFSKDILYCIYKLELCAQFVRASDCLQNMLFPRLKSGFFLLVIRVGTQ